MSTQEIAEKAGEVAAAVAAQIESANAQTDAVIQHAGEAIDAANERAQEIAEAAMNTEIGRRVGSLEMEAGKWQSELESLRQLLQDQAAEIADLKAQLSALGTLTVAAALEPSSESPSLSTPPASTEEVTEALAEVTEVLPESLSDVEVVQEAPVAHAKQKRHWLI